MMKRELFIVLFSFLNLIAFGHDNQYIREAEDAILEVIYIRTAVTDTTDISNKYYKDDVMLRIGSTKSLFCGVKKLWNDSIATIDYATYESILKASYEHDPSNFFFLGGRYWAFIYKNFKEKNVVEENYFNQTNWRYIEEMNVPEWEISDSTKNILGLECIKATTMFKGRTWEAWFTPEIPIQDGPWKLCGLPGLILDANDANNNYKYEAVLIRNVGLGRVGFMRYKSDDDYKIVSRDEYFNSWWKYVNSDNVSRIKSTYGVRSTGVPSAPRTINYDMEETDYDHK